MFNETHEATHQPNGAAGHKARRRFQLVPFKLIAVSTDRPYLIKGLIPREGLTVVWGPPKCGKSFLMLDVAMHVALGWDYRGRRVAGGPVVYIACEGERGLAARIEAFRSRRLSDTAEDPDFHLLSTQLNLAVDAKQLITDIRAGLNGKPCAAVIVDTLNRSIGGSESDDKDMSTYVRAADAIRMAFGCAVIIIHHCGLDDKRPRGHTSLTGAADCQISIKRDTDGRIVAEVEYQKDGPEGEKSLSRLEVIEVGTDEDGDPITSCVIVPADDEMPAPNKSALKGTPKLAFDLLRQAIDESGAVPPACTHIPQNTRTTTVPLWRGFCYRGMVAESDKPDSQQKAFVRASKRLQELGVIGIWNNYVWITGHAGH